VQGIAGSDDATEELANSTYRAWQDIIDLCIREEVDFLLVAGDVYDSTDRNIQAQLQFKDGLKKLEDQDIKAYVVHGNHDPDDGWSRSVKLPKNTTVFPSSEPDVIFHHDADGRPLAAIVGMSFPTAHVMENIALKFPSREEDWPWTIGLLHCTVGNSDVHEKYAPCSSADLRALGYDYWALGHIHKPTAIQEDNPPIIYPGNPQGRDMGETGDRGCQLVSVDSDGSMTRYHVSTAQFRWDSIEMDISDTGDFGHLEDHIRGRLADHSDQINMPLVCRLVLTGSTPLHRDLTGDGIRDMAGRFAEEPLGGQYPVYLERVSANTVPVIDRDRLVDRDDVLGEICRVSDAVLSQDGERRSSLKEELEPLFQRTARSYLTEPDDEALDAIVQEAEALLLSWIAEEDPE